MSCACVCVYTGRSRGNRPLLLRLIQLISSPQRLIICHLTGVGLLCASAVNMRSVWVCACLYATSISISVQYVPVLFVGAARGHDRQRGEVKGFAI